MIFKFLMYLLLISFYSTIYSTKINSILPLENIIKKDAILLETLSKNNQSNTYNDYLTLLLATRKKGELYVNQLGTIEELEKRKKFLAQFTVEWKKYKSRLFSNSDIEMWAKNWLLITWV
ncbi:MAG: hypothetical protein ACJAZS_000464 [Alteromonas naphthalenivorans]|jgi:hypothetical protein